MPNDSLNVTNSITSSNPGVKEHEIHQKEQTKRSKPELTKISANFVNRAVVALELASEITGDNQTDVLNRSVQVYAYITKMIDDGKLIFMEDPATGAKERLVLL